MKKMTILIFLSQKFNIILEIEKFLIFEEKFYEILRNRLKDQWTSISFCIFIFEYKKLNLKKLIKHVFVKM